jgi:hypothetical protein
VGEVPVGEVAVGDVPVAEVPVAEPNVVVEVAEAAPAPPVRKRRATSARSATAKSAPAPRAADPAPERAVVRAATASAPPSPAGGTGLLLVNSLPWSEVAIDGEARGRTSWKGSLAAGAHAVTLTDGEGRSATVDVTVKPEGETRLCWDFQRGGPCSR